MSEALLDFSRRDAETQRVSRRAKRNPFISRRILRTLREPKLFNAETAKFAEFFEIATAPQAKSLCASASLRENEMALRAGGCL
jgi:hypothetical protein